ncbi:MAG: glycosyltransferase [Acidobacteria bacterium]|nr:glycosyltransferase [Acidobacteriota bacterium]
MVPEVSIIIPTRNRVAFLQRAVESVLHQTFSNWELIIVDDGSEDATEFSCRTYLSNPRIHYCRSVHQGVSAARNIGIEMARADWLAFLDSDDLWSPAKLFKQLDRISSTGDKICHTDEVWIRRGRRVNPMKKHRKPEGWIFKDCLRLCVVSPSAVMVHKSIFEDVGRFDPSYPVCEDYELWLRVSARYRVSLVAEKLVTKFGGHQDQLSRQFWGMDRWRARALYSRVRDSSLCRVRREAAFDELRYKVGVLMRGYTKRQQMEGPNLAHFIEFASRWWEQLCENSANCEAAPEFPALFAPLEEP